MQLSLASKNRKVQMWVQIGGSVMDTLNQDYRISPMKTCYKKVQEK